MKFSLVLATVDRKSELKRFLESLNTQNYKNFEIIVVDQNPDNRVSRVIRPFQSAFKIRHLRSERGLSRARNVGLKYASGDVVAFPDDDCWYPFDLLESVFTWFQSHPHEDGLTGRCTDEHGRATASRWSQDPGRITRFSVWRQAVSISVFLRRKIIKEIGKFDESLGAGAHTGFGAGEETDFLLRAIGCGFQIYFEPKINVGHPDPVTNFDTTSRQRAFKYGAGMGRVLRKHRFPVWYVGYCLTRPLGGSLLSLLSFKWRKALYHLYIFSGRVRGWLG